MLHGLFVGSLAAWYFGAGPKLAARTSFLSQVGTKRTLESASESTMSRISSPGTPNT